MKRMALFLFICMVGATMLKAQGGGDINTVVGVATRGFSGDGGPAVLAELYWPANLAFDKYDNMYIADQWNNRIRVVNASTGFINTIAGNGVPGYSGDSLPGISAELNLPASVAVDTFGNVFIPDFNNNRIREVVDSTGFIYTIAGNGVMGYSGDGGPATAAEINHPHHTVADNQGNVFFADENNNVIRKIVLSTGIITTVVGNGTASFSGDNGPATAASLNAPKCVNFDRSGNMYIADWQNARIRKVDAHTGTITTVAGNGEAGYCCDDVPATATPLNDPYRVVVDTSGNVFIADGSDNRIRWVSGSTEIIHTLAGTGNAGFCGDGGPAEDAELDYPPGLALDHKGNLFIADLRNNRVREVNLINGNSSVLPISDSPGVSVYPNPACTQTTVYFTNANTAASLILFTLTGQMIWEANKNNYVSQVTIPLNTLNSGVYLLKVQIQGETALWKRLDVAR